MKISLNWVRDYIEFSLSPKELADKLTQRGLNVEEILSTNALPGVVLGKVIEKNKHPNADKLSCTKVDIGSEILSIVCGASNVAAGQLVAIATVGCILPGNFEIKKAKIRGEESFGMICSKSELGYEKEKSPGIWELDSSKPHKLGQLLSDYLGGADTIFDIDITSNRPDCLTLIGVAREIASIEKKSVKLPKIEINENSGAMAVPVKIEDKQGCMRYSARVIRGVKIAPSPSELVKKIESAGLRSINNIVDITNFVMLECGQPLHAFDLKNIRGQKISVRRSKKDEPFTTLDGKAHKMTDDAVMICDAEGAIAIGGVMGGQNSEISDSTNDVLLEAAMFEGTRIRRTAKSLGIQTDAANRFGRGINPDGVVWALDRAASLMAEMAGGSVEKGLADENFCENKPRAITLTSAGIKRLLGCDVAGKEVEDILNSLECKVTAHGEGSWIVNPPSFRLDLNIPEDLIEEIARVRGLDSIPDFAGATIAYHHEEKKSEKVARLVKESLRESGFSEITTNSMSNPKFQKIVKASAEKSFVKLMNPISDEMSVMRVSLLPGILDVIRGNLYRKNPDVRVFEFGRVYRDIGDKLPEERTVLAGCAVGSRHPLHWSDKAKAIDFYDIQTVLTHAAGKFKLDSLSFNPYSEEGVWAPNSLEIRFLRDGPEPLILGHFGRIQSAVCKAFDVDETVWGFELDYTVWLEAATFKKKFSPISRFPVIHRDLALIVDLQMPAGQILQAMKIHAGPFLEHADVFDLYHGAPIPPDKKSIAFSFRFQSQDRTLTEEEIDLTMKSILKMSEEKFGAGLRAE